MLTADQAREAIKSIPSGLGISRILDKNSVKLDQFFALLLEYPSLERSYSRAQEIAAEVLAAEIIEIADEDPDPQRARNRIDSRKWYASKLKPKKFGDKVDINIQGQVDITAALAAARQRALLPQRDQDNAIDVDHTDITDAIDDSKADAKPVDANEFGMAELLK